MLTRYRMELAFAGLVFLLGALAVIGSLEHETGWATDGPQAGFFPFRLGLILMAVSALIVVLSWRNREILSRDVTLSREAGRRVLGFALPVIGFVALAQFLGLYVASAAYLAAMLLWQGKHRWTTALAVALGFSIGAWLVFEVWFQVPLLKGPLESLLGLD
jgi:hypothetical protein